MIFNCISNIPAFFNCVNRCSGDVAFIDSNGNARDLKQLAAHAEILNSLIASGCLREMEVHASGLEDRQRLMRFMHEMHA